MHRVLVEVKLNLSKERFNFTAEISTSFGISAVFVPTLKLYKEVFKYESLPSFS